MAQENWWDSDPVAKPAGSAAPRPGPVYGAPPKPDKPDTPKTNYRTMTPDEVAQRNLDPTKVWQISSEGSVSSLGSAGGPEKKYKVMPQGAAENLEKGVNAVLDFNRITKGYKKDYAGNSITGGLENSIQKRFGGFGTPGQQQWWADVNANDNVMRNALFGASLTAGEQTAWERTTVTPDMDPALVEQNLKRRKEIATSVLKRRTDFFKANGYDPEAVDALLGEGATLLNGVGQSTASGQEDPSAVGAVNVPSDPGTYRPDGTPVDPNQLESGPGPNEVWIVRQPDGSIVNWETISGYGGGEVTPQEWMSDEARLNGMDQVDGNDPAYQQFAAGVGDIVEGGINNTVGLIANPVNTTLFRALGYDNYTSDLGQTARDALGLPEGDQTIGAINQAVTGGLSASGLARQGSTALSGVMGNALGKYGATPMVDAVTAGTAAASGEAAKQSGAGPVGQSIAMLAGGAAPASAMGAAKAFRPKGGGITPDGGGVAGAFQRQEIPLRKPYIDEGAAQKMGAVEKTERGAPIVRNALDQDKEAVGNRMAALGGEGRASSDPFDTGVMVQGALERQGKRTKDAASVRYQRAEKLSGDPVVQPTQAVQAAARHVADLQAGGTNTNAAEIKFITGLGEDLSSGQMTVSQLRNLRTEMRGRLKESGLDHNRAEGRVMDIMDAVSKDIETGLVANPRALEQYKAGDRIWRDRMEFRKDVTEKLIGRDGKRSANETASAVNAFAKKDPIRLKRLIDEFEPDEAADFKATLANNLGRNGKGDFSPAIFVSNLDPRKGIVSPRALRTVFGDEGVEAINDLQAISKSIDSAEKQRNFSNTGNPVGRAVGGLKTILVSGFGFSQGGPIGAFAAPAAASWLSNLGDARTARLLMNPVFTKAMRQAPQTVDPKAVDAWFTKLAGSAAKSPVFAADVEAFKAALMGVAAQSPLRAAASEQENN